MAYFRQAATGHPPIVITDIETNEQIEIQYWSNHNYGLDAEYEAVTLPGSTSPHGHYSATGQRTIPFEVHLAASAQQGDAGDTAKLRANIDFLESCLYPEIVQTSFGEVSAQPHLIRMTAGRLFDEVGRLRGLNIAYLSYGDMGDPLIAQATFSLEVVEHKNYSYREVRSGQRRRSIGSGPHTSIWSIGRNNAE